MKKSLLCAAWLVCSTAAVATPQTWKFSYTNLQYRLTITGDQLIAEEYPRSIVGTFTGEDLNGDHLLTRNELTSLKLAFLSEPGTNAPFFDELFPLGRTPDLMDSRNLDTFAYDFGQQLAFSASWGWMRDWHTIVTGLNASHTVSGGGWGREDWNWTPATTLAIAPIPEPSTYALLAVGLLGVALASRRNSPAQRIASASPAAT
jgi:hypothetical protein